MTQPQLDALRDGIEIEGIQYGAIEATLDREQGANVWLTFAIREGKNREVRNVLEHLGLAVNRLIRVSFGPFQLGELAEGAVEEIKTPHLREQLGPRVTALAGADFTSPIVQREPDTRPRRPAAPEQDFERPPAEREGRRAPSAGGRDDRREGPRGKAPREAPRHGRDERRPSGPRSFGERPPRRDGAPGGARAESGRGEFKGLARARAAKRRAGGAPSFGRAGDRSPISRADTRGRRVAAGMIAAKGVAADSVRDRRAKVHGRNSTGRAYVLPVHRPYGDKPRRHEGPPGGGRDDRREGGRGGFGKGPPRGGARPSFGSGRCVVPAGERSLGDKPRQARRAGSGGGRDDRREGGRSGFGGQGTAARRRGRASEGTSVVPRGERSFGDKPRRPKRSSGGRDDRRERRVVAAYWQRSAALDVSAPGRDATKAVARGRVPSAMRRGDTAPGIRRARNVGPIRGPRVRRGRAQAPWWRQVDDRPGKRTFHGPRRDEALGAESEPKRAKRSGPIQDRKGRRVLVERVPPQAPERTAEPRPEFKPKYKPRPGAKPTAKSPRDRGGRGGPRPSRPR